MHLGRIILLAGAALAVAIVCQAQTSPTTSGGMATVQPDKVQVIHASQGPQEALSAYKKAKQEAPLQKMVKLAGVPPASPVRVASDCDTYTLVVRDALDGLERKYVIKTTSRSAGLILNPEQIKAMREYVEQERKQWDDVTKMTQAAANYHIELRVNKAMLKKAAL